MATSAQILGFQTRPRVPARWAGHYRRLCEERDRLLQRDCSTPQTSSAKLDDMTDAGSEESDRSLSFVSATVTQEIISEILNAIRRIEKGTFGVCEITGEPIEDERLNAIPWARCSLAGQRQIEEDGSGRRAGIPALQSITSAEAAASEDEEVVEESA